MKKLFCLFYLAISMALLAGCTGNMSSGNSTEEADWEATAHENVNNFDDVTMNVKEETVSPTGLTLTFENNSDKQGIYGDYFLLEKKIDESWYEVPTILSNYGFNDIGYDLPPSDVQELTVDWDWLYGKLDSGEYRIVKDISDFRQTGDYTKYYLAAVFTIG